MNPIYIVPISVKGIVFEEGKIWLRKNERNEWEIPGGKMDIGEQPRETVARELLEELGFKVEVQKIIDAYLFTIKVSEDENKGVLVVSYMCKLLEKVGNFELIGEGGAAKYKKFSLEEITSLNMPQFYKDAILKASNLI
jgi:ADP-ribose pyrophosphatase YjhB (NUDIX family)